MSNTEVNLYSNFKADVQLLWSIENALLTALPNMIAKAGDIDLVDTLCSYFDATARHKLTLESIFLVIDIKPNEQRAETLESILAENLGAIISTNQDNSDMLLVEGAQEIEHYQIQEYHSAAHKAERLGLRRVHDHLLAAIAEEMQICERLQVLLGDLRTA